MTIVKWEPFRPPRAIQPDKITAEIEDGVAIVTAPIASQAQENPNQNQA